uniref:Uncharacterized protein n=1 Tax=Ditylenchus dipsaci TaxID=166011 RepID=A0A915EVS2_9BILA
MWNSSEIRTPGLRQTKTFSRKKAQSGDKQYARFLGYKRTARWSGRIAVISDLSGLDSTGATALGMAFEGATDSYREYLRWMEGESTEEMD